MLVNLLSVVLMRFFLRQIVRLVQPKRSVELGLILPSWCLVVVKRLVFLFLVKTFAQLVLQFVLLNL